jgi:hypothetical protein
VAARKEIAESVEGRIGIEMIPREREKKLQQRRFGAIDGIK